MSFWRVSKNQKQEVIAGFRLVGWLLCGFFLFGGLAAGLGLALDKTPDSFLKGLGRFGGAVFALVCFAAIAALVNRWAKIFPGLLGYGALRAIAAAAVGYAPNKPLNATSRLCMLLLGASFLVSALVTAGFVSLTMNLFEKAALLFWVLSFAVVLTLDPNQVVPTTLWMCSASVVLSCTWLFRQYEWKQARRRYKGKILTF